MQVDTLIENINIATMQAIMPGVPYAAIYDGYIAIRDHSIVAVGQRHQLGSYSATQHIDGQGGWITPGLIDCHTHLVYGGHRALEFEQRLQGVSYAEIAKQGGGIMNTVNATRQANDETLYQAALHRLKKLHQEGVTCIEIKSGYGLDVDTELRLLKIAKALNKDIPVTIKTTYLGAHALPAEFANRKDDYIDFICNKVMPKVHEYKLADAVDVFCDDIGFSRQQCQKVFETAHHYGLRVKAHAEQLTYQGGAKLVADYGGLSADHLEFLPEQDIDTLVNADVVGVLLPAAFYYLHETQKPPIAVMRQKGLSMAVASDCNPGSAPMASLLTAMNQACVLFALTPEEALSGTTRHAAKALGLEHQKGQIAVGMDADLLLWNIDHPAQLSYAINMHSPVTKWIGGQLV